jgi:hypothetical protein
MARAPFITYRYWPHVGQQIEIYLHFLETFKHETEWFSFLDVDEFFVLRGVNDIVTFMQDYQDNIDVLYFNRIIYGHSGKLHRDDGATLMSYRRRAVGPDPHTKMICRSAAIDPKLIRPVGRGAFWHFLDNYELPGVRCRDVLFFPMDGYSADFPHSAMPFISRDGYREAILERAYIAHFQFKSEADFLRRWRRGGFSNGEYWRTIFEEGEYKSLLQKNNTIYDTYLAEHWFQYTTPAMCFGAHTEDVSKTWENVALHKPSWQSSVHTSHQ